MTAWVVYKDTKNIKIINIIITFAMLFLKAGQHVALLC